MRRILPTAAVGAVALALGLSGCGGSASSPKTSSSPSSSSSAPAPSASAPSSAPGASSSSPVAAAPGSSSKGAITVDQSITDPVMGDHVVAQGLVRDFPAPASMPAAADGEVVLVKVTATAGTAYYAGWQTTSLDVIGTDGTVNPSSDTDDLDSAMTKAGYTPFPDDGDIDSGKTATGWVPFVVDQKNSTKLTLRMERGAASTSDGKDIKAENFDVPLVK